MSWWRSLFTENPMMVEITRFRRKFFGSGGSAVNGVILALTLMIYIGILALVWYFREDANPIYLIFLQTFLFTLLGPSMLHAAIAGERERRSWDFLLVAPVSHGQIVTGKFMGAGAAILACAVALVLPIAIGVAFYERSNTYYIPNSLGDRTFWSAAWNIALAEALSISWGFVVSAMTLFFSARCKRGFVALGTVLAILVASLIVWPILLASAGIMGEQTHYILNFFHPFWALAQIDSANVRIDAQSWERMFGIPQIVVYIGMTAVFLFWTERTLRFADGEVKFIPKHKDA